MQIQVFDYQDYKKYINDWASQLPKAGHGFYRKMAMQLNVSTTLLSQIFKGDKQISLELAHNISGYLGMNDKEAEFFILLVEFEKAGSHGLKELFLKKIKSTQKELKDLSRRIEKDIEITDLTKSIYYSDWLYTGVRNLIAIDRYSNINQLAEYLNLPIQKLRAVIDFLAENNFCILQKNGHLKVGPQKTFISKDSPWVNQHHQNWRVKAMAQMPINKNENLFYTGPMSLSHDVAFKIKDEISKFIDQLYKEVGPSKSETVRCLNIDWFEY